MAAPLLQLSYALLVLLGVGSGFVVVPVSVNLILTSFLIIFIGAHRSLNSESDEPALSQKEAWMFPVMGSCVLFSLYVAFKFLGKDVVNLLLGAYFAVLAMVVLQQTLAPLFSMVLRSKTKIVNIDAKMPCQSFSKRFLCERLVLCLTGADVVAAVVAAVFSAWHYKTRHFMSNNVLGVAFAVQGIEHIALGTYLNGSIMLVGLFFYDVFWVFGTDVMVTVARSFDAPIKLLFLRAQATDDTDAQFSMLGLGDIVIPGIFIALLLRFDRSQAATRLGLKDLPWTADFSKPYFNFAMIGYVLGLGATLFVMYTWQAAQPALLYLSPAGLLFSLVPSLLRGEFRALTAYSDDKDEGKEQGGDKDSGDKKGTGDGEEEDEDKDSTKTTAVNGDSADKDSGLRKRVAASH